jgi:hypothetical protein
MEHRLEERRIVVKGMMGTSGEMPLRASVNAAVADCLGGGISEPIDRQRADRPEVRYAIFGTTSSSLRVVL